MSTKSTETQGILSLPLARVAAGLVALGVAGFAFGILGGHAARTVSDLVASWLFFTGIAVGGLAFTAILRLCGARWAAPMYDGAWRIAAFIPLAAVLLVAVIACLAVWAPWVSSMAPRDAFWLALPSFAGREAVVSALLLTVAYRVVRPHVRDGGNSTPLFITYALLFSLIVSIWSFDFVVGPTAGWNSTLIGPHLFVGSFLSGIGVTILLALRKDSLSVSQRRDAGTLVFVLAIFWGYLSWSQFLTLWYGNLPEEVGVLIRRNTFAWRGLAGLVIVLIAALPFVLLLNSKARTSKKILAVAATSQLLGLWLERGLMVTPALGGADAQPFDFAGLAVALGVLGLFVLSTWRVVLAPGQTPVAVGG